MISCFLLVPALVPGLVSLLVSLVFLKRSLFQYDFSPNSSGAEWGFQFFQETGFGPSWFSGSSWFLHLPSGSGSGSGACLPTFLSFLFPQTARAGDRHEAGRLSKVRKAVASRRGMELSCWVLDVLVEGREELPAPRERCREVVRERDRVEYHEAMAPEEHGKEAISESVDPVPRGAAAERVVVGQESPAMAASRLSLMTIRSRNSWVREEQESGKTGNRHDRNTSNMRLIVKEEISEREKHQWASVWPSTWEVSKRLFSERPQARQGKMTPGIVRWQDKCHVKGRLGHLERASSEVAVVWYSRQVLNSC